jgi:hypothetical protein
MFSLWIERIVRWTATNSPLSDVGCPFLLKVRCTFRTVQSCGRSQGDFRSGFSEVGSLRLQRGSRSFVALDRVEAVMSRPKLTL